MNATVIKLGRKGVDQLKIIGTQEEVNTIIKLINTYTGITIEHISRHQIKREVVDRAMIKMERAKDLQAQADAALEYPVAFMQRMHQIL